MKYGYDGINNFLDIVKSGKYNDNTIVIKNVIECELKVCYIIKEQGSGKTIDLSMIYEFFTNTANNKNIFSNLVINEHKECMSLLNSLPVVAINFGNIYGNSLSQIIHSLKNIFMELYIKNYFLVEKDMVFIGERRQFENIINMRANEYEIITALYLLTKLLYRCYSKKVLVLIDNLDELLIIIKQDKKYEELMKTYDGILKATIKDNQYLYKVVISSKVDIR